MADDPPSEVGLDSAIDAYCAELEERERRALLAQLPPPSALDAFGPGALLDDFELVGEIGQGGMGRVFEARQRSVSGQRAAVKVLRRALLGSRSAERFQREIATIARLDHPAIVQVLGAGVQNGSPFYAMRLVEGISAARLVQALRALDRPPETAEDVRRVVTGEANTRGGGSGSSAWGGSYVDWVAGVGVQIAEALEHARERGVVHRDVKPANVMITPSGRAVLLDFGLALGEDDPTLTESGDFLGTLSYAAPEQVRGEAVDTRADVYSLGATLYELVTLRRAFDARSRAELLRRIEREDPQSMGSWVPFDLRTICGHALAKRPGRRYATPGEMAHDLREFCAARPIRARPPGPVRRAMVRIRRHPRLSVAALVFASVWTVVTGRDQVRAAERAELGRIALAEYRAAQETVDELLDVYLGRASQGFPGLSGSTETEAARAALEGARHDLERHYRETERLLQRAFDHVAGHVSARDELARLHALRLEHALRTYEDVVARDDVRALEDQLRSYSDGDPRYAELLDARGRVRLAAGGTGGTGATITVWQDGVGVGSEPFAEGASPLELAKVREGSYRAVLRAPGRAEVVLPFLVRRDAAQRLGGPALSEFSVDLPAADDVPEDFVYVQAGWTLVEDDPARWEWIDAFMIRRFEATLEEFLGWSEQLEAVGTTLVGAALRSDRDEYRPRHGGESRHPARGLSPMELASFARALNQLDLGQPDGWYVCLTSIREAIRAARGADARRYPWGDDFDWSDCGGYHSSAPSDSRGYHEQAPFEVGSFVRDRSPFGVRDLAGSVREATCDIPAPPLNRFAVFGGSFEGVDRETFTTTTVRRVDNVFANDVGLRLVLRRLPAWARVTPTAATVFRDDFERPDGPDVGGGWAETVGDFLRFTSGVMPELCFLENGRLVCEGGVGNFSEPSVAWHGIQAGPGGAVITATMRAEPTEREVPENRGFGFQLVPGFPYDWESPRMLLRADGSLLLTGGGVETSSPPVLAEPFGRFIRLELRAAPHELEARAWDPTGPRPNAAQAIVRSDHVLQQPHFVGIQATNLVGMRVEVETISVESLGD